MYYDLTMGVQFSIELCQKKLAGEVHPVAEYH
jgi:hypothetical protein